VGCSGLNHVVATDSQPRTAKRIFSTGREIIHGRRARPEVALRASWNRSAFLGAGIGGPIAVCDMDIENRGHRALMAFTEQAEKAGPPCENDALCSLPDRSSARR
jgi:hypothetical protein